MASIPASLEFKYFAFVGVGLFITYLAICRKPSLYGWLMAILCLYLPASAKFPVSLGFGVNLLNALYVALFLAGRVQGRREGADPLARGAILWVVACAVAWVIGSNAPEGEGARVGAEVLKRWLDPLIVYALVRRVRREGDKAATLDAMLAGSLLFSMHLVFQGMDIGHNTRVGGLMAQPNQAASFVAAYSPIVFVSFAEGVGGTIAAALGLALAAFGEIQTVSRGGLVGLGAGVLVAALLSRRLWATSLVVGAVVFLMVSPSFLPEKIVLRFQGSDMQGADVREAETSLQTRYAVWSAGASMLLSEPQGVGLGQFQRRIADYGGPVGRDAHNIFLLIWAECGVAGMLAFLWLLWQLIRRGWVGCRARHDPTVRAAGVSLVGGMAAILLTNLFSATIRDVAVFGYAWVLAALIPGAPCANPPVSSATGSGARQEAESLR